jgi:hypothetical protein
MVFVENPLQPGQRAPWFTVVTDAGIRVGEIAKFSGRQNYVFKPFAGMVFTTVEVQEIHGHMVYLR